MDSNQVAALVERTISEVLSNALPGLRDEIVRRISSSLGSSSTQPAAGAAALNDAQSAVQAGQSQMEILDALIDGAARFSSRVALYVLRGNTAFGWRARGFADCEAVKAIPIDIARPLAARAIEAQMSVGGAPSDFDSRFAQDFGRPQGDCYVLPLVVRDKPVALVYADAGQGGSMDRAALDALVRTSSLWLEVSATRKATAVAGNPLQTAAPAMQAPQAMAAAAGASAATMAPISIPQADPFAQPMTAPAAAPAEDETQRKARRFAKLLVEEIQLYNKAKVSEGRLNHDLYDRLKDDIEKSRESYQKRFGNSSAAAGDYFTQELVRILADNDLAVLGSNFPR